MIDSHYSNEELSQLKDFRSTRVKNPRLMSVVERNIDRLLEHEQMTKQGRPGHAKLADCITSFAGSMWFVYLNAAWFLFWILANEGFLGMAPFDPYPYGLLTMIVSLEAIMLAIFVLIAQNRLQSETDRRAELDVQINLLTEYEVTRILKLVDAIAKKVGCEESLDPEIDELKKTISPEFVIQEIEQRRKDNGE
jgi:uncharacterized membrane protein